MSYGTNAPNGFIPVKKLDGSAWTGATNPYQIVTTYATAIFRGDPVTIGTSGYLEVGVAGSTCVGVFWGVKYTDSTGVVKFMNYWPGNPGVLTGSVVEALVIDDPNTVFSVQETNASGAAGTPLALADRGLNINFMYTAGSTSTGQSAVSINNASVSWPKPAQMEPLINRVLTGARICGLKTPALFLAHEIQGIFQRSSDCSISGCFHNAFASRNYCWHQMHQSWNH